MGVMHVNLFSILVLPTGPSTSISGSQVETHTVACQVATTSAVVTPLFALSSMRKLYVSGWDLVMVNDSVLERMARSWPSLEDLKLHS